MFDHKNIKQWAVVFRGLANPNRLQILKLLHKNRTMTVTKLTRELKISFKNTSRNLAILSGLDIVESEGRKDHVYYSLNPKGDKEINKILKVLL